MKFSLLTRSICNKTGTLLSFFQSGISCTGSISRKAFRPLLCMAAAGVPLCMDAVPAWPGTQTVIQPDGSYIELRLLGDEYGHLTVDAANGIPLRIDSDGFWRPSGEEPQKALARRHKIAAMRNQGAGLPSFPRTGEVRSLIVLVEFSDIKFVTPDVRREFDEMLNLPGFDRREHIGCAADYFREQSMGQFSPVFDVYGPVTADRQAAYYGENDADGNDLRAHELAIEVCRKLDNVIDFADYDLDNDGQIDNVYLFYAGYGENFAGNKSSWIWPHANHIDLLGIPESERTFDGKVINSYGCCAELYGSYGTDVASIGTFCHEFGHILGLPDTYDVNYNTDGLGNHPDKWDIMASGSYLPETRNCGAVPAAYTAVERWLLGWAEPTEISRPQSVTLPPLHSSAISARISTDNPDEFFILENRQKEQGSYDRYIPYHGMLVWHVDRRPDATLNVTIGDMLQTITCAQAWDLEYNAVNMNASHQCLEIEKASGSDGSRSSADTPFPGRQMRTEFTDNTSPSMRSWNGTPTEKAITGIRESNGMIYFDFMGGNGREVRIETIPAEDIGDDCFTARWLRCDDATDGYRLRLYKAQHQLQNGVVTLNETFSSMPDGWRIDGDHDFREGALMLGGTQVATLLSPETDLDNGGTLTISARQSGNGAATSLTIRIGDEIIDQYVPTDLASEYTVELPEGSGKNSISISTERRKSAAIEQITLRQDVESVRLTLLPEHNADTDAESTSHTFSGLELRTDYAYTVEATGFAGSASPCSYVTTGRTSGIDRVQATQAHGEIETYYTPDGRRADPRRLAPGLYIVRKGNKSSKIIIGRL
ncbi:MAG: M6 family metalloprotease domain-containing protein [Muribaculaceae bacterium]|nr:M6 family metalloprotease domain-containing protein [Muribaculaceae bacterium]